METIYLVVEYVDGHAAVVDAYKTKEEAQCAAATEEFVANGKVYTIKPCNIQTLGQVKKANSCFYIEDSFRTDGPVVRVSGYTFDGPGIESIRYGLWKLIVDGDCDKEEALKIFKEEQNNGN